MVAEMITKELIKAKPGAGECAQIREIWSTDKQVQLRPGYHCLCEFSEGLDSMDVDGNINLPIHRYGSD